MQMRVLISDTESKLQEVSEGTGKEKINHQLQETMFMLVSKSNSSTCKLQIKVIEIK